MEATTQVPVPESLRGPHRFVAATRDAAKGARVGEDGRLELGGPQDVARLFVSRDELRRALLILQALYREAERRGYGIEWVRGQSVRTNGVAIVTKGQPFPVEIHELRDSIPMTEDDLKRWKETHSFMLRFGHQQPPKKKHVANGRLELRLPRIWDRRRARWADGPRGSVETKLGSFFVELEEKAEAVEKGVAERARRAQDREHQERLQLEQLQRQRQEEARGADVTSQASAWATAREIRAYANALRKRLSTEPDPDRQRFEEWCDWAMAWAQHIDPLENLDQVLSPQEPPTRG